MSSKQRNHGSSMPHTQSPDDCVLLPLPIGACRLLSAPATYADFSLWPVVDKDQQLWAVKVATKAANKRKLHQHATLQRKAAGACTMRVRMAWATKAALYVVEPLALGRTLAEQLDSERSQKIHVPVCELLRRLGCLAQATSDAHAVGVLHRDLKPDNALCLTNEFRTQSLKLADFGLACLQTESNREGAGTTAYLAPEVAAGQTATSASDVFSLGATFIEMIIGLTLYEGETETETALALTQKQPLLSLSDLENFLMYRKVPASQVKALAHWIFSLCHVQARQRPSARDVVLSTRQWAKTLSS